MKTSTVREARARLSELLKEAQSERVLITNHGDPVAVLVGVEGKDMTDVFVEYDDRLLEKLKKAERVGGRTSIEDVRTELGLPAFVAPPAKKPAKPKRRT